MLLLQVMMVAIFKLIDNFSDSHNIMIARMLPPLCMF